MSYPGKISPEMASEMRELRASGFATSVIAAQYGVSKSSVSRITSEAKEGEASDRTVESRRWWPEWELWRNLNRRYCRKKSSEQRNGGVDDVS